MPIITVQITKEETTPQQKAEVIQGLTEVMVRILNKPPELTHVIIQEIATEDWGVGGLPALEYRRRVQKSRAAAAPSQPLSERHSLGSRP